MAIISSHILDSLAGDHARGIRIDCRHLSGDGDREVLFNSLASAEGRIKEQIDLPAGEEVELSVYSRDYFESRHDIHEENQIVSIAVIRLVLSGPSDIHHVPIMLSPHSYSIWWSGDL